MRFLSRLLLSTAGLLLALPLAGCKPTVTGCESPFTGGADLPDPSFEETPSQWTLASHSSIDPEEGVCNGTHSLKLVLSSGLGSPDVTRSANFTGIQLNKEYEIGFHYRFENCAKAGIQMVIGKNYTKRLQFDGSDGTWKQSSIVVKFSSEPAWIEINPERQGNASDFQGPTFDNNLMWLDDFTIKDLAGSN